MLDIVFIAIIFIFFALAAAYTGAIDRGLRTN